MSIANRKTTALIVEDDEVAAMQLKRILGMRFSMDVALARDYPHARLKLDSGDFDIVAVDYTLPGGAGKRLLEEISAVDNHPPIILVGGREDEKAAQALGRSASGYVVKDAGMESAFVSAVEKSLAEISLKQAERSLESEQSFTDAVLNALPDTFSALKLDGTGIRWNRRLSEVTGYTDEEIASMTPADFFRAEDLERVTGLLSRAASGELEKASVEVTLYTKDGRGIPYEYIASLLKDPEGRPLSICGIGRDISARKLAETEAGRQRESLEALVGERTELLWEANQRLAREVDERRRAQDEARKSELYYRSIVEYSTDMVGVFDAVGTLIYISPSVTSILGYRPEEILGRNGFEYVHPDDIANILANHESVISGGGIEMPTDCRFLVNDGRWHTLEATGRSYLDDAGELRIVVNARDVTERKQMEKKLREGEQVARALLEAPTDAAALLDIDGTILDINEKGAEVLGTPGQALVGRSLYDLLPSDLRGPSRKIAERVLASRTSFRFKERLGSRIMDYTVYPVLSDGEVTRAVLIARDITERKRAEHELESSRDTLLTFLNATKESAFLLDRDGTVLLSNETVAERLGTSFGELQGSNIYDRLPPDVARARREQFEKVLNTREPLVFEDEREGTYYENRLYPVPGVSGDVESVAVFGRDITGRKRAQDEIRETRDNLQAFLDATTDFAMLLGPDGTILTVNRMMADRFGLNPEELIGTSMYDRTSVSPEVQERRVHWIEEVLRTGKPGRYEDERGGMCFEHNVYPVFGEGGKVDRIAFFTRDITERKQVEQQIKASHDNLAAFLNATTDYALLISAEGRILAVNQPLASRLGMDADEMLGMSMYDETVLPPAVQSERVTGVERVIETGEPFIFEDYRDGVNFEHTLYPVFDEAGKVDRVAFYSRDVTERKRAEAAIKRSEAQFRTLVEQLPVVTYTAALDLSGSTTYISPQVETLLGISPETWTDRPDLRIEHIHPDDRERVLSELASSHESGEPFVSEYRMLAADGHLVFVHDEAVVIRDDAGNPLFTQGVMSNVTERVLAEEALRQSEEMYRSIYTVTPDIVYLMEPDGTMMDANPAILERLGMSLEEFRDTHFRDYFAGENASELEAAMERLRAGEEVWGLEVKAGIKPNIYVYEINASPLFENDRVIGILSLARDVTERKRSEEELVRLNRELDGYAQTVSHDLRTPLSAIKLANETLLKVWSRREDLDLDLDVEIRRFGEVIELGTVKMEALIAELLRLARAGKDPIEVTIVDVLDTVRMVLAERDSVLREKGVWVEVDKDLGSVRSNPTQIYQLFGNIIDNAIKHNDAPSPAVEVRYLGKAGDIHHYKIKDNGPGIPPDGLKDIFLPFVKGDSGETGIGLAIVEKIVHQYGGTIRAYNDGGAAFEFYIRDIPRPPDAL